MILQYSEKSENNRFDDDTLEDDRVSEINVLVDGEGIGGDKRYFTVCGKYYHADIFGYSVEVASSEAEFIKAMENSKPKYFHRNKEDEEQFRKKYPYLVPD